MGQGEANSGFSVMYRAVNADVGCCQGAHAACYSVSLVWVAVPFVSSTLAGVLKSTPGKTPMGIK